MRRKIAQLIRNILGIALIMVGIFLCLPGVPGPGSLVILVGLGVLDFKKKDRKSVV